MTDSGTSTHITLCSKPQEIPAREGLSLSYKGKTLLSRIDPMGQADRIIEKLITKERTLFLCPSPLYGYGLSLLLEKLKSNSAVLCIEADNNLFELSNEAMKDLMEKDKGLLLLVKTETSPDAFLKLCAMVHKNWGERSFRRVEAIHLTGGWQLFPEVYEKAREILQKDIAQSWANAMTLIRLGRSYIRNAVRNLALIPQLEKVTTVNFASDPILVLGAGPSMDIILDELSKFKKPNERPFRIICADTCLPALKERGIEPDLAVILECQHWNLRDFLNTCGSGINAAIDLSSLPASAGVLGGKTFLFMTPWTELALFDRLKKAGLLPDMLAPLGSVGLTAVQLALRLGQGPVITAGMDFSFTPDAYHARSTPGHLTRLTQTSRFFSMLNTEAAYRDGSFAAVSKSGISVRSDPALRNYRSLFEEEFSASDRVYEINGPGLALGVNQLNTCDAVNLLTKNANAQPAMLPKKETITEKPNNESKKLKTLLNEFINNEKLYLLKLLDILTGKINAEPAETEKLLDTLDYLWAHFPECAGAGGRRPDVSNLAFLKRVRTEIIPFLKLWEMAGLNV